jgi:hypothetical protein
MGIWIVLILLGIAAIVAPYVGAAALLLTPYIVMWFHFDPMVTGDWKGFWFFGTVLMIPWIWGLGNLGNSFEDDPR